METKNSFSKTHPHGLIEKSFFKSHALEFGLMLDRNFSLLKWSSLTYTVQYQSKTLKYCKTMI
mgnify:CR=1 FL=1|jgi:hypothetical protein